MAKNVKIIIRCNTFQFGPRYEYQLCVSLCLSCVFFQAMGFSLEMIFLFYSFMGAIIITVMSCLAGAALRSTLSQVKKTTSTHTHITDCTESCAQYYLLREFLTIFAKFKQSCNRSKDQWSQTFEFSFFWSSLGHRSDDCYTWNTSWIMNRRGRS